MPKLFIGQKARQTASESKRLVIGKPVIPKAKPAQKSVKSAPKKDPSKGKAAYVKNDDEQFLIVCDRSEGEVTKGVIAVPNADGIIIKTETEIEVPSEDVRIIEGVVSETNVAKAFDSATPFELDSKAITMVEDEMKNVIDVKDVSISGLGSTFMGTTPRDRDHDYVIPGAFDKTLAEFKSNPVMLVDHTNKVNMLAGSFNKVAITEQGLALEGKITNSPHPDMKHIRFLVAEGHLKAFSIGGIFMYDEDGFGIKEIRLFETSLTPIPANQDALFQVRKCGVADAIKCFSAFQKNIENNIQLK